MKALIMQWLTDLGVENQYLDIFSQLFSVIVLLVILLISFYVAKHQVLVLVHKMVTSSRNTLDDLFIEHKVFSRIASLIPFVLLLFLVPIIMSKDGLLAYSLTIFAKVAISFQVASAISASLNVIKSLYREKAQERYLPLNASIQGVKLLVYLIATILSIAFILDRSPLYLLSGLGALTAVLLLIFQDTIKGLVASIQISANKMVAPGDWIELPKYGADGDVLEIGLNTVKVQNFDRTVTTVPTYALTSGSFKNWRDMFNSGGRRIKRSLLIDIASIDFLSTEQIEKLKSLKLIENYISNKETEIANDDDVVKEKKVRQLTNVGTFRVYIETYLKTHEQVNDNMTCMVRQLAATENGLPLELYFFSRDQNWVNYERIQADIFDHLFAIAPYFGLRIFQHPTGHDWRNYSSVN